VHYPEEDGGHHEAELLLHRAPEEDLLAHPGEGGDQQQTRAVGAVNETRRELLGYRAQRGQEPVGEEPREDGGDGSQGAKGKAQANGATGEAEVEPAQSGPQRRRDGQSAVEEGREGDEPWSQSSPLRDLARLVCTRGHETLLYRMRS
jgi:hypothetical protein